jgi:hypothetical protein
MVVPVTDAWSTRMSLRVRGLLMPLSTLMLFAMTVPVEPPSALMPAVRFLYALFAISLFPVDE